MTFPNVLTTTDAAGKNARHAVGAHLVPVRAGGRVLLQRRSLDVKLAPGRWSTVCGNLEAGESVQAAAVREFFEETGAVVAPGHPTFATVTHFVNHDDSAGPAFAVFFTATTWNGTLHIREPHKADALDWFDLDELPEPIVPHVANALADIRAGRPFSLLGWNADGPEHA